MQSIKDLANYILEGRGEVRAVAPACREGRVSFRPRPRWIQSEIRPQPGRTQQPEAARLSTRKARLQRGWWHTRSPSFAQLREQLCSDIPSGVMPCKLNG